MTRSKSAVVVSAIVVLAATGSATGCAASAADPASSGSSSGVSSPTASAEAFAGVWHSVTPSLEFLGLSINSTSSEAGVLAARLTFSGVVWEGRGRIAGDSLVMAMTVAGTTEASGTIVAHVREGQALSVELRPVRAARTVVTFVRGS
jgi:hypothetical protein